MYYKYLYSYYIIFVYARKAVTLQRFIKEKPPNRTMKIINPKIQHIMKHKSTIFANGLHTPPCGGSHGNLSSFRFRNFLLMLFLLLMFVGSNVAWASTNYFTPGKTIYFHVSGDCKNWGSNQFAALFYYQNNANKAYGYENENYSDRQFVGNTNIGSTNRIKCTKINDDYYSVVIPSNGTANIGYVRLIHLNTDDGWCHQAEKKVSADSFTGTNNCVEFRAWDDGNPYTQKDPPITGFEQYNSGECITNACGGGGGGDPEPELQTLTESYCLRGDLWLGSGGAWESAGTIPSPSFTANNDNTIATLSYVIPAISEGAITSRITLHGDNHGGSNYKLMKTVWDSENSNITQNAGWTDEKGLLNVPQQGSFSPKSITLEVTKDASGEHLKGTISAYSVKRDGWHLYIDDQWVGEMDSNGEFLLIDASYEANSIHRVFVTNSKRNGTITRPDQYWSQGISWFGGLYIDKSGSNVSFENLLNKYYGDKFSNQPVFPTVGTKDARGRFKIGNSAAEAVKFTFDGGKITINTLSRQNISGTTYCLTGIFNGWNNSNRAMTWSNDTKAHTYTLSNVTSDYSKNEHGWKAFKIVPSGSWEGQIHGTSATIIVNGVVVPYDSDNECTTCGYNTVADNRILVQVDEASDITFNYYQYTGGINIVDITRTAYVAPVNTYTVTIHPNPDNVNETIVRSNVPENSNSSAAALNLSSITYGNGTATWYTNEACTTPFSTVTGDMDLYAKWGISGNYWLVGDQWMYDTGSSWNNGENPAFTTTDGVATVTFIAPMGRNRFEIIKDNNWGQKINNGNYAAVVNSASPVAISVADGHMEFTLNEMKKVTIIYDGKVSVRAEAYDIHKTGWNIAGNSGLVGQEWNNSACPMDNNGEKILRNINTGNYEFKITPVGSWGIAAVNQFSAANVDKDNSTSNIFRNWTSHLFGSYKDGNEYKLPMNNKKDRNVCIQLTNDMAINGKADIKIAFDGAKITVNVLPKYTVSFNSNGGSEVASQSVFEGTSASEPSAPTKAGYDFVKWQLSSADYDFSEAVTGNITLDAVWAYKTISSVVLNESAHTTWLGNSNFVLTPTMTPSDLITKTVEWTSDAEGVATVSNGTVHAVSAGTATITCTVTDMFDHVRTATCDVTVAPCEMTTDALYSMTVTGYNSSTGSSATLNGLWNESSDNTEPATFRIVKLKLNNNYYVYDDNGTVKMSTDASLAAAQWYEIPTGENFSPEWTGSSFALYEFKNVLTGKYLRRGNGQYGGNSDWYYYTTLADNRETDGNIYKFFYDNTAHSHLVCREGVNSTLRQSFAIHNNNMNWADGYTGYCAAPMVVCGYTNDPVNNAYTWLHQTVVVDPSYANPNYTLSLMNSLYYRMKADATVRANLANGLAYGSVITVRLYADAATTVQLTKADGTEIETINLSADAACEYTYTVAYGSELVGATAFIIKAADNHAGIASIEVSRMHAASPDDPALTWDANLSSGVTQSALAGTFQHVASSARSEGAIHYTSSNEAVATVAADGTVTPIMAGSTTITATIEQSECYAESSVSYNVTLTEPTLAELIAADAGAGITLTHNYAEDIVIDKAITINGNNHAIGNLTVQMAGDLTLSGALTVNDFSIYAKAGNSSIHAESGQVRYAADYLTANGNAYFYYTVDPNGHVQYGWYDFTVPFPVDVMTGIKGIQESELKENFINETDYAIMEFLGDNKAEGKYAYKKFRGVMQPNKLYSITLDCSYNYNLIRFQKTNSGPLVADESMALPGHVGAEATKNNWNGVGNGTLHHVNIGGVGATTIQVYQSGDKSFLPVTISDHSLAIGTAFMIQGTETMVFSQANHALLAPSREANTQPMTVQIAREEQPFSDQLFIGADELAGQGYTQGVDVAKAGDLGSAKVAQIWVNAYNSKLCAHEAQLINGRAKYALSLYAPADGTYTLTGMNIPEGSTLYLTKNGKVIWNLGYTCDLDLTKGTSTEYGLLLVESPQISTGVDEIHSDAEGAKKIMHNGILYILHNGKVFNAQGAVMK